MASRERGLKVFFSVEEMGEGGGHGGVVGAVLEGGKWTGRGKFLRAVRQAALAETRADEDGAGFDFLAARLSLVVDDVDAGTLEAGGDVARLRFGKSLM